MVGNAIVGGMETYVRRLIPSLQAEGMAVACLCPFESAFTQALRDLGCDVFITPMDLNVGWESVQFTQSLVRALRIDVMHAHLPNAHALASLVGAITGTRTLATIHGRTITLTDLEAYRLGTSQLITVCQYTQMHALNLGVASAHAHMIPNGIDAEAFDASRGNFSLHQYLSLGPESELVGFIGRLSPEKNPSLFLRMAAIAHTQRPDLHFVLIGDGPLGAELRMLAGQLGLGAVVHFAGVQDDMRSVYDSLRLVVLTSDSEGMPLALIEAMACGVPTVATQIGGVPELVRAGMTGTLVPPRDPVAAAREVLVLMNDPALRASMGQAARELIREHFTLAKGAARIIECLGSLARARSRPGVETRTPLRSNNRRPLSPARIDP